MLINILHHRKVRNRTWEYLDSDMSFLKTYFWQIFCLVSWMSTAQAWTPHVHRRVVPFSRSCSTWRYIEVVLVFLSSPAVVCNTALNHFHSVWNFTQLDISKSASMLVNWISKVFTSCSALILEKQKSSYVIHAWWRHPLWSFCVIHG